MELSTYMPSLTEGLTAVQSITEAHDVAVKVKCEATAACSVPAPEICAVYIKEELKEDWDDISFKEEPVFPEDDEHGRKIEFCTSKRSSKNVEASDDLTANERVIEDTADGDEMLSSEVVTADANGSRNLLTPSVGRSKRSKPKPSKGNAAGISKLSPAGRVSEVDTDGREKPALKGTAGDITSVDRLPSAKKVRKDSTGGKNLSSSGRFTKDPVTSAEVPKLAELVVGTADSCELCARAAAAEEINGSNDNSEASSTKPFIKQHSSKQNLYLQHSFTVIHECPDCEYRSKFKYQLQLHILAKHSLGKLFQCPDCQNEYFTKRLFRHHILLKHSSEQLEHSGHSQSLSDKHSEVNSDSVNLLATKKHMHCPKCEKTFFYKSGFTEHYILKHTEEKPFHCSECDFAAVSRVRLSKHIFQDHSSAEIFRCSECDYSSFNKSNFKKHCLLTHSTEKPFQCSECDFVTKSKEKVKRHFSNIHSSIKPHKCLECNYASVNRMHLKRHIFSKHSFEKPFLCTKCEFTCATKQILNYHSFSAHSKVKPFKCSECKYACITKQSLDLHFLAKHSESKSFKCPKCPYVCVRIDSLQKHCRAKHNL